MAFLRTSPPLYLGEERGLAGFMFLPGSSMPKRVLKMSTVETLAEIRFERRGCHCKIFFSKAALCISGLILSHSLVKLVVVEVLIDYLTGKWKKVHLPIAATIINFREAISTVLAVFVTHIADSYIGRYQMLVISALSYVMGLMLLRISATSPNPSIEFGSIYAATEVIALGKSGLDSLLLDFLEDQLSERENPDINEDQKISRTNFWRYTCSLSGYAIGVFWLSKAAWEEIFMIATLVMGSCFLLFFCGFYFYYHKKPTGRGSPFGMTFGVFKAAKSKWDLNYTHISSQFYWKFAPRLFVWNHTGQIQLLPKVQFFRWLDKAAIVETSSIGPVEQENCGNLCPVKQVREVKRLLTLIPMWMAFFAFSLIRANGPWQVEVHRLLLIKKKGIDPSKPSDPNDPNQIIPMSNFWLLPQFILLGLMDALAVEGLQEFVDNYVTKSMKSYGKLFNDCVLGFGNFFSIGCILLIRTWFKDVINNSHLDRYFLALAILGLVFYCIYVFCVLPKYAHMEAPSEDLELEDVLEDGVRDLTESKDVLEDGVRDLTESKDVLEDGV
ncbi:hypothetical protein SO802_033110 [Lithocarpus litseifolius]|uniref:Peptide transporter n=1 Tax=Lithocarpus litseifolius TaxID=425828 RepID=A0AAW2BC58_9ROSI